MEFLIISGMSGAGKSRAADVMEDLNYYCVDNLPVALIPRFAELCMATQERYEKVALVMDVRERDGFADLFSTLDSLKNMGCTYRMLFMDADTATLIKRYKESRRPHPLAGNGTTMEEAIRQEYELMTPIRARADYVINSTGMTHGMLQQRLYSLFGGDQSKKTITVNTRHSAINTEFPWMQIWFWMSGSFQTLITKKICGRRPVWIRKCATTCLLRMFPGNSWTS